MALSPRITRNIRDMHEQGAKLMEIAKAIGVSNSTIGKYLIGIYRTPELPRIIQDERWAPVESVAGSYFISSYGRVFSYGSHGRCGLLSTYAIGKTTILDIRNGVSYTDVV